MFTVPPSAKVICRRAGGAGGRPGTAWYMASGLSTTSLDGVPHSHSNRVYISILTFSKQSFNESSDFCNR